MSNITEQITRLQTAKANLKTSLEAKGVTVAEDATLDAYPALVDSIPQGGGGVEEKDVNFYDYDGTCVYSYTKQEFLALDAMPANPDHSNLGLESDNWTGTLAQAKTLVSKIGFCDLGALYHPSDGKTSIYITVDDNTRINYTINVLVNSGSCVISWGDDSNDDTISSSTSITHTYSSSGDYVIKINSVTGKYGVGDGISGGSFPSNNRTIKLFETVKLVILGDDFSFNSLNYPFSKINCPLIINKKIKFDNVVYIFNDYRYKIAILPEFNSRESNYYCEFIKSFGYCYSQKCIMPLSISYTPGTSLSDTLYRAYNISKIIFPEGITEVSANFIVDTQPTVIVFPSTITSMNLNNAITCSRLSAIYVFATTPPTLNSNIFNNVNTYDVKIYVPASAVEDYKAASGWSTYASQIQAIPE